MWNGNKHAGFTLLEIVIAVSFFSVIAVSVGQALVTGQRLTIEVRDDAAVMSSCEDMMRQLSSMNISDIASQDGSAFTVGGIEGSGTVAVTNPYLGSDDIARVVLSWNGNPVVERAFGNAAMLASGGESGGGGGETPPAEPQWYDEDYVLTSPNYPDNYPNNYDHTWTITEPGALKMRVRFSDFNTRHSDDRVYIKNGAGTTVASYYGNKGSFTSAQVDGDTIKIRFSTNSWGTRKGWRINMYQYYK